MVVVVVTTVEQVSGRRLPVIGGIFQSLVLTLLHMLGPFLWPMLAVQ